MASSKRPPTYKVETKLPNERKRRKSDLVVMWQSIWGVSAIIAQELWMTVVRMWEFIQLWFSSSERFLVQTWLEKYLPYVPEDFSESWRDGRLLAILLNKLHPGCFPEATRLDPDYGLKNVYRVFDTLEIYFGIKPNVSVEEIVTCSDGSDQKLFEIILELKNITDRQPENEYEPEPEPTESTTPSTVSQNCIAKGTGLAVGFVGRMTNFIIFCAVISDMDVVVEIKGPNTVCSERITKRSPKKKLSVTSWQCPRQIMRSVSLNLNQNGLAREEDENFEKRAIPLEYEIMGNQISVGYKPIEKGRHKVTILWHGHHVSDSPYSVTVEDPSEIVGTSYVINLKSALKTPHEAEKHDSRKISVRFQESQIKPNQPERSGKILSRKVLRYIVKIHGKDIPVNADNTEALATELLKMDYDFETSPSFHRRNSWGFTGDAERKKSVIRQFCVDVNELDAQISQRRSRSLSVNPKNKISLERSDSFDSLTSKLNILNEDVFENNEKAYENENDYAYLDEDIHAADETEKIPSKEVCELQRHAKLEKETDPLSLLSELSESKFDESLKNRSNYEEEHNTISSLSTDTIAIEKVDSSNEDLHSNVSPCLPVYEFESLNVDKIDKMPLDYGHSNTELHNDEEEHRNADSATSKYIVISSEDKIPKKTQKRIRCRSEKDHLSRSLKTFLFRKKNSPIKILNRKVLSGKISNPVTIDFRNRVEKNTSDSKKNAPLENSENLPTIYSRNLKLPMNQENKIAAINESKFLNQSVNVLQKLASNVTNNAKDLPTKEELCIKRNELRQETINHSVTHYTEVKDVLKSPQATVEEPEIKKLILNYNINAVPKSLHTSKKNVRDLNVSVPKQLQVHSTEHIDQDVLNRRLNEYSTSLTRSAAKTDGLNTEKPKLLRTHTLKSMEQFDFKQFNVPLDTQSNISPIKAQIGHWESALSSENQSISSRKSSSSDIELVNIREKLAFWENACRAEGNSSSKDALKNNSKISLVVNKMATEGKLDSVRSDGLQNLHCTGTNSNIPDSAVKKKSENFVNKEVSVTTKKETDDKISLQLQVSTERIQRRSFSDPVVSETAIEKTDDYVNFSSLESSRREYSSSSIDDNLEQYDSDDSEDSGGDYLLQSTEDEYIDDEISERASEYWGDLSILKEWKGEQCTSDYSFLGEDFLKNYQYREDSFPEKCKVFGIATYYGYVAIKNRFQVHTGDAGFGNLSVSMQGFRQHEVSLISVVYSRNGLYEVTYQVMTTGYYLISIRWMDKEIPGSPFVCKVTF